LRKKSNGREGRGEFNRRQQSWEGAGSGGGGDDEEEGDKEIWKRRKDGRKHGRVMARADSIIDG